MATDFYDPSKMEIDKMDIDPQFSFFPLLPKELRDMIWSYTFTFIPARTIEVYATTHRVTWSTGEKTIENDHAGIKRAPVPQIFQVCSESRERAYKEYPQEFGPLLDDGPTFFDFKKDTLLFYNTNAWYSFNRIFFKPATGEVYKPKKEMEVALKRFREEARFIAIKGCIDRKSKSAYKEFYRLEELALLDDSFKYWPNNPSFKASTREGGLPQTLPTEVQRLRQLVAYERALRRAWIETSEKNGVKLTSFPRIEYKDLGAMEISMGEEA